MPSGSPSDGIGLAPHDRLIVRVGTMATLTRIDEGDSPSITIHPANKIARINDNIYGGFTE